MSEWKEYRLGDICQTNKSQYSAKEKWQHFLYLDTGNITKGIVDEIQAYETFETLPSRARRKVVDGDIIYSLVRPNQEHYGYISNPPVNLLVSTGFVVISANRDVINPLFLYNYLTRAEITKYLQAIGEQSVCTYPAIKPNDIENLVVKIPSIKIQTEIASILSSLDDKIAVNKKICENLEAQAQALFKHWFVDFAPFKDGNFCANREQNETCFNSAEVQPKITGKACKFVESELGLIPEGWRVGTLGDICVTNKRTYGSSSLGIIEYIDTGSVTNNKIDNIQVLDPKIDKIPSRARRAITEGDILFSSVRPNQRHFAYMYNPNSRMVASTGFIVITANWSGYRYYIYQYLIQDSVINYLQAIAEQSVSTYPSINASDITNIKVIIPPDDIIGNYAAILSRFMGEIDRNNQESSRLATLRDTLLPKLMSGQIKLSEYE